MNRPAGQLFPDLYLTDDAFSKDQNFFYRELDHQQIIKNPEKGAAANAIDATYIPVTEKTLEGFFRNPPLNLSFWFVPWVSQP